MQKVKIIVYIGVCLIALSSIAWADGHLQINGKGEEACLKG